MARRLKPAAAPPGLRSAPYTWQRAVEQAVAEHGIPTRWPEAVTGEAAAFSGSPGKSEMRGRFDLRDLELMTIDGADARDFDDAVCCHPEAGGGFRLWVAIADVSSYVQPGTALDEEARRRGTSVYFPQRVIPMLPEALSNGLCSLNPDVERLCLVCELQISTGGQVQDFCFFEAVMRSRARLTYEEVAALLQMGGRKAGAGLQRQRAAVLETLHHLHALYRVLRKTRSARGAIDFREREYLPRFDEAGIIEAVMPTPYNEAYQLIEECMLCANVAAAELLQKCRLPALFRVHEPPAADSLEELRRFLSGLGLSLAGGANPKSAHFQKLLQQVEDKPQAEVVQLAMLRAMNRARYQAQNCGHFGLHYATYTHFTSPIRRYPDLLVHRALRSLLHSQKEHPHVRPHPQAALQARRTFLPQADMKTLGGHCSETERRAEQASRDAMHYLKCSLLRDRVGDEFEGIISGVTHFGLFVQLQEIGVDGMAHISELGHEYFHHRPEELRLQGEKSGISYQLGQAVRVRLLRVDAAAGRIALCPADFDGVQRRRRRR